MPAKVFISYSHKDEELRDQLEVQLAMLKRQGLVEVWHDRRLLPGDVLDWEIDNELNAADVVLLLVSPDFLASDYCYNIESAKALQRHRQGDARLISVILRPCDWMQTDLRSFVVTPKDGRPVTRWPDRDEALLDVAQSIRRAIEKLSKIGGFKPDRRSVESAKQGGSVEPLPRSSNLRLRKEFTKADKDRFALETFEYLGRFFEGSLAELEARNSSIEVRHRRINADCFTAAIYKNGRKQAGCTIRFGGIFDGGISYSSNDDAADGSCNEILSVESDDQKVFLRPMGMPIGSSGARDSSLTREGAAEYLWSLLVRPLQGDRI